MKKTTFIAVILLIASMSLFANGSKEDKAELMKSKEITLYAYDSFTGDWGPGPSVIPAFEKETGIKVNVVTAGDAVEMLNKVILEGDKCKADVVLGITDDMAERAYDLFESYSSPYLSDIPSNLLFDTSNRLLPFDYGAFAFVFDTESGIEAPESLEALTDSKYKDKVILIDPRTSSVGMGLLLWTYNELGDDYLSWWEKMKDNALTIASGWSSAYGLFTEGEAPIVLSYTTSPVYHVMNENTTRYQALVFENGHEATIEGLGILKSSQKKEYAEIFVDYILSNAQCEIAVTNSMYPTNSKTELPDAFIYAPKPAKLYKSGTFGEEKTAELLKAWTELMTR